MRFATFDAPELNLTEKRPEASVTPDAGDPNNPVFAEKLTGTPGNAARELSCAINVIVVVSELSDFTFVADISNETVVGSVVVTPAWVIVIGIDADCEPA
jgi:hypothetical protein